MGQRGRAGMTNLFFSYLLQGVGFIQGFVMIPLYIHYLGVALYGYWIATIGIINSLSFMDLGLAQPIGQRIASSMGRGDTEEASRYFWVGLSLFCGIGVLAWMAGWAASFWIPGMLKIPPTFAGAIIAAFLLAALALVLKIVNDFLRGFGMAILRPGLPVAALAMGQLLGLGVSLFLLINGFGVIGVSIGLVATEVFCLVMTGLYFARLHARQPMFHALPACGHYRSVLGFTPHVFVSQVSFRITQQIDATVVTFFLGPSAAVIYAVHKKLAEFLGRLMYSIWGSALLPLSHLAGEKGASGIRDVTLTIFAAIFSLLVVLYACYIVVDRPFVSWWISPASLAPLWLVVAIALARLADNALNVSAELHMAMGEINFMAHYLTFSSLLSLGLFAFLPRIFGMVGVPLATIAGSGSFAIFFMIAARRNFGLLAIPPARLLAVLSGGAAILILSTAAAAWTATRTPTVQWAFSGLFIAILGGSWLYLQWRQVRAFKHFSVQESVLSGPVAL